MIIAKTLVVLLVFTMDVAAVFWFKRKMKPWLRFLSVLGVVVSCFLLTIGVRYVLAHISPEMDALGEKYMQTCLIIIGVSLWHAIMLFSSHAFKTLSSYAGNSVAEFMSWIPLINFWMVFGAGFFGQIAILFELNI